MNLPLPYNTKSCRFFFISSLFYSFTCLGQSETNKKETKYFTDDEKTKIEAIAKSKAYHKYVFEVEDFKTFEAQFTFFKKELKKVVLMENIIISKENEHITVICIDKNADHFLYKLKKILHENGFRLYKFKEELSENPIRS